MDMKKQIPPWDTVSVEDRYKQLLGQAECDYRRKEYRAARDLCTKAISLDPGDAQAYLKRADCFMKLNSTNKAIEDCSTVIDTLSCCSERGLYKALVRRAAAFSELNKFALAESDVLGALALKPNGFAAGMLFNDIRSSLKLFFRNLKD